MAKRKRRPMRPRRPRKSDALIEKLRRYIRNDGPAFLADPNITSLGIGHKMSGGKRSDRLCVQFTVATKADPGPELESLDTRMIPERLEIDGETVPTDVMERQFAPSFQMVACEETDVRKQRVDPLVPGVSVSHSGGSAGTLGMVVFDQGNGDPCMLSNWHVLHGASGAIGDAVVQPGPHDDNDLSRNHAGSLLRSHLGPAGDCAIARIEERDFEREILGLGVRPARTARVDLGDRVIKSGRTTDVTLGVVRRIDVMAEIQYSVGPRQIGCFEIGPEDGQPPSFEVSLGGDSGSVWLVANEDGGATDILAGLHFAGESSFSTDEHALACYAHSVFKKLDIALDPIGETRVEPGSSAHGYDSRFLATRVPTPELSPALLDDTFLLDGSPLIPYTHFSVCQSKSRGLARFVAWNIDGGRLRRISRNGLRFLRDSRVAPEFQHGNELYSSNPLDRGHVARRVDLAWGSQEEASRANRESFLFTNIAPQHQSFNQSSRGGLWGRLENALFEEVDVEGLRVSVMGGPIFGAEDPVHRGVRIPGEFWKLVAYTDTADGLFKVRAFVLTQRNLLRDIEVLDLDPFRMFQVSLARLEGETGLGFGSLAGADTMPAEVDVEAVSARRDNDVREVRNSATLFV